jgi:adenine-specific DNA-methyltransferase
MNSTKSCEQSTGRRHDTQRLLGIGSREAAATHLEAKANLAVLTNDAEPRVAQRLEVKLRVRTTGKVGNGDSELSLRLQNKGNNNTMSTAQHGTAQHSTAQHSTAQHSTAQHSTAQSSTEQHSTAQLTLHCGAGSRHWQHCLLTFKRRKQSRKRSSSAVSRDSSRIVDDHSPTTSTVGSPSSSLNARSSSLSTSFSKYWAF